MDGRKEVNIYIEIDSQGVRKQVRWYGAVVEFVRASGKAEKRSVYGGAEATYNQISLIALESALSLLICPCSVTVYMQCDHVKGSITQGYADRWNRNGWKNERDEPVANAEEWKALLLQASKHELSFSFNIDHPYREELEKEIGRRRGAVYQQSLLS